jgi:hypothetical protein
MRIFFVATAAALLVASSSIAIAQVGLGQNHPTPEANSGGALQSQNGHGGENGNGNGNDDAEVGNKGRGKGGCGVGQKTNGCGDEGTDPGTNPSSGPGNGPGNGPGTLPNEAGIADSAPEATPTRLVYDNERGAAGILSIEQTPDSVAIIKQTGIGHSVAAVQGGSLSSLFVVQRGELNSLVSNQFGNLSAAHVFQNGNNNKVFVDQASSEIAGAAQSNNDTLTATVLQGRQGKTVDWNIARVRQDGRELSLAILQLGSGTEALPNTVNVSQRGSKNIAIATQHSGVAPSDGGVASGASGDEYAHSGGARSAEITILQSNSGNYAEAEQHGRGQLARIEQSGQGNLAKIIQLETAINAVAVIRQSGNGNSYSVEQDRPGQYHFIHQTGNGNAVVSSVIR